MPSTEQALAIINKLEERKDSLSESQLAVFEALKRRFLGTGETLEDLRTPPSGFIETISANQEPLIPQEKAKQFMTNVGRPVLQGTGSATGALLGTAEGVPTGPGAVVTGVAGGALGYAFGDEVADLIENYIGTRDPKPITFELKELAKNLAVGAGYEIGGQAIGPALSGAAKTKAGRWTAEKLSKLKGKIPPIRAKAARKKVGEILAADLGGNRAIIAENIEEAKLLEDIIPGLQFRYGQLTNDAKAVSFEKALIGDSSEYAIKQQELQANNIKAVQDFLESQKSGETLETARKGFQRGQGALEAAEIRTKGIVQDVLPSRPSAKTVMEGGEDIVNQMAANKQAAKDVSSVRYKAIKGVDAAPTERILKTFEDLAEPFERGENLAEGYPSELLTLYREFFEASGKPAPKELPTALKGSLPKKLTKTPNMTYIDLNSYRKRLSTMLERMQSLVPAKRNKLAEKRIATIINSIEEALDFGARTQNYTARAIKKARTFHRATVAEPFEEGRVGKVLADEISEAKVAYEFFQPKAEGVKAAKEYRAAIGKNPKADAAIEMAINDDFLDKVVDSKTLEVSSKKLANWLRRYKPALEEYGLWEKFSTISKAQEQVDTALELKKMFSKSIAADILKSDPGREVADILASKFQGRKMVDLMRSLGTDKRAIAGVQDALVDELQKVAPESIKDIATFMTKNERALNAAFADAPEKLQAMKTYQKALDRLFSKTAPVTGSLKEFESVLSMITSPLKHKRRVMGAVVNTLESVLKHRSRAEAKALLIKASLDPNFAYAITNALKADKPNTTKRLLKRAFITYGQIYSGKKEER